ncbi:hypothetical protein [Flagellimonas sp. 2504JD4-2]
MKRNISHKANFEYILIILAMIAIVGCSNEFNTNNLDTGNMEAPIITGVTDLIEDSPVQAGVLGSTYYIKGANLLSTTSIKYNGFESNFNRSFVTENEIISQVPLDAPFLGTSNKLTVETSHGVAEYDFLLFTIDEFTEEVVEGTNAVVITGGDFTDVDEVSFVSGSKEDGNLVEREARIIEVTPTTLTVEVPEGVTSAFIFVNVNGAFARSKPYGFNYAVFTDEIINDWELGGWDGTQEPSNEVALGSTSIRRESGPWAGLTFTATAATSDLVIADHSSINLQIYPANDITTKLACGLNDFDAIVSFDLVPHEWNSISIPLTDFYPEGTGPETITRIDFQIFRGEEGPYLFYLDQFGFIE